MRFAETVWRAVLRSVLGVMLAACGTDSSIAPPDASASLPPGASVALRGRVASVNTRTASPLVVEGPDGVQVTPAEDGTFTLVAPTATSGVVVAYRDTVAYAMLTAREMRSTTLDLNEVTTARALLALSPPTISRSAGAADATLHILDGDARVSQLAAAINAAQASRGVFESDTGFSSGVRTAYEHALPAFDRRA